jgi:hypothetical protein
MRRHQIFNHFVSFDDPFRFQDRTNNNKNKMEFQMSLKIQANALINRTNSAVFDLMGAMLAATLVVILA